MELIRISDCKLKIMLTPTDMCQFELNCDNFGENREQMHRSFRLLLAEIHRQTGFDADDTHLSVQYFPSREGGCEMFISNLQEGGERKDRPGTALSAPPHTDRQVRPPKKQSGGFRRDCAYRFETVDRLLTVCKRLFEIGFGGESAAWQDEKGDYFLFLTVPSHSPFSTPEELDFIVEYGSLENAPLLRLYIREHASPICRSNAVFELAKLS